jgi:hypothetical protein
MIMYEPFEQIVISFWSMRQLPYLMIVKEYYDQFHNCVYAKVLHQEERPNHLVRIHDAELWDYDEKLYDLDEHSSIFLKGPMEEPHPCSLFHANPDDAEDSFPPLDDYSDYQLMRELAARKRCEPSNLPIYTDEAIADALRERDYDPDDLDGISDKALESMLESVKTSLDRGHFM